MSMGSSGECCERCGRPMPPVAKRCVYCSAIRGRRCPRCKAVVPVGAEVCMFCNATIPSSVPNYVVVEGEAAGLPSTAPEGQPSAPASQRTEPAASETTTERRGQRDFGNLALLGFAVIGLIFAVVWLAQTYRSGGRSTEREGTAGRTARPVSAPGTPAPPASGAKGKPDAPAPQPDAAPPAPAPAMLAPAPPAEQTKAEAPATKPAEGPEAARPGVPTVVAPATTGKEEDGVPSQPVDPRSPAVATPLPQGQPGHTERAELTRRIVGDWRLSKNTTKTITFHTDGTVTASYDHDKRRRWRREGDRLVFIGTRGECQDVIFLPDDKSIRMGDNVWLRAPSRAK